MRRRVALKSIGRRAPIVPVLHAGELSASRPASSMRACDLRRSRLRTAAQPLDLAPDAVGERVLPVRLLAQRVVLPLEELAVAPARLEEAAGVHRVEVEHALGHVLEEPAIMADDQKRGSLRAQQLLEPEDAVEVEVVRRLVHQEQSGAGDERARHRDALLPAARERAGRGLPDRGSRSG